MNFGYAYLGSEVCSTDLDPEDETDRYSWQLYEHMIRHHPPINSGNVLEVGSGRGGACFFVSKYYQPATVTGVDLSDKAVDFCNRNYKMENLKYLTGSASELPVKDSSMDLVINAESSHAYPDFQKFLSETLRVLKPGGYLMTTDNRKAELLEKWKEDILSSGFEIEQEIDITENVLESLNRQEERKEKLIKEHVPSYFKKHFREFAGMKGSAMYEDFRTRRRSYKSYILKKAQ